MNRNFPRDWHEQAATDNENPGEFAESESETRALMKIAEEFNPTSFIDCHTGSWGLFFPFASQNIQGMTPQRMDHHRNIARKVVNFVDGGIGTLQEVVGYDAFGSLYIH